MSPLGSRRRTDVLVVSPLFHDFDMDIQSYLFKAKRLYFLVSCVLVSVQICALHMQTCSSNNVWVFVEKCIAHATFSVAHAKACFAQCCWCGDLLELKATSRGSMGEKISLKECLEESWSQYTKFTGIPCHHDGIDWHVK